MPAKAARPTAKAAAKATAAAPRAPRPAPAGPASPKLRCPECNGVTLTLDATATNRLRGTIAAPEIKAQSASFTATCTKGDFTLRKPDLASLLAEIAKRL